MRKNTKQKLKKYFAPASSDPKVMHPLLKDYFTYAFYKSAIRLKMNIDTALRSNKRFGLSSIHLGILRILSASKSQNQKTLGQETGTDKATMVKVINQLLEKGHITWTANSNDRRIKEISITSKGRTALSTGATIRSKQEDIFLSSLEKSERVRLKKLITKISNLPS